MSFVDYVTRRWAELLEMALQHAVYVLIAILIAAVIGVGLGALTYRNRVASSLAMTVCSMILTVPSFALFGLMVAWVGLGNGPAVIALVAYGLLPIVRNTVTGLQGVDPAIGEAAKGMGMNSTMRMLRVDLPLAWPVILTGLRVSTMLVTSIFAIAAYIGADGLGQEIDRGLSSMGAVFALDVTLAGTVGIVIVAFILDGLYLALGKVTTPKGIRN